MLLQVEVQVIAFTVLQHCTKPAGGGGGVGEETDTTRTSHYPGREGPKQTRILRSRIFVDLRICIQGEVIIEFNYSGVIQLLMYSILSAGMFMVVFFFFVSPAFIKLVDLHSSVSLLI